MLIMKMLDQFEEEIDGVEEYSRCAMELLNKDPEVASMYRDMARAEMDHARKLSMQLNRKVDSMPEEERANMLKEMWEHQKKTMVEDISKATACLDSLG